MTAGLLNGKSRLLTDPCKSRIKAYLDEPRGPLVAVFWVLDAK